MPKKISKRQENLLAKIAAQLGKDFDEIKEKAAPLYSLQEEVLERQSILNFFEARVRPTRRTVVVNGKSRLETDQELEKRYNEWRFMKCKNCNLMFAYAWAYEGIGYCSLECLDDELRKKGLELTRDRDVKRRWGPRRPAIVPPSALESLEHVYLSPGESFDVPLQSALPRFPQEELHESQVVNPQHDTV